MRLSTQRLASRHTSIHAETASAAELKPYLESTDFFRRQAEIQSREKAHLQQSPVFRRKRTLQDVASNKLFQITTSYRQV